MKIKWEIDSFSGGDTYTTQIDDEDFAHCEDIEEAKQVIEDAIRYDMQQNLSPIWEVDEKKLKKLINRK